MRRRLLPLVFALFGYPPIAAAQPLPDRLDAVMRRYYEADQSPGGVLLIRQGDRIVFSKGYGIADLETGTAIDTNTHFRMASVSKQFTAMSVYRLVEAGKLSLKAPLAQFFASLPEAVAAITVEQLVSHTSGIWDYEALIPDSQKTQVLDADVLELVRQQEQTYFPPGTRFRYSNTGYCLLSLVVEQVGGLRYADFADRHIFRPLGMNDALVYEPHAGIAHRAFGYHRGDNGFIFADQSVTSAAKGDGGVYLSAAEYAKWSTALMRGDFPSPAYLKTLEDEKVPVKDGVHYSFGWFIGRERDGTACLFHSGESTGFRNIVYVNPEKELTVALFTNRDDSRIADVFDQVARLLDAGVVLDGDGPVSLFRWLSDVY